MLQNTQEMTPRIVTIDEKKLAGKKMIMSLAANKTGELWKQFMQAWAALPNTMGTQLFSLQVYDPSYFSAFDAEKTFEKWATAEVSGFDQIPEGFDRFLLPAGLYAVFHYKGISADPGIYQYIFGTWLPRSAFLLDNRPHFEILGEKYRNNDPDSEEEIWIPVRPK